MKRVILAFGICGLFFVNQSAIAGESVLASAKCEPPVQLIGAIANESLSLALKVGQTSIALPAEGFKPDSALNPDMPLLATAGTLGEIPALSISFGMNDGAGLTRSFALVLIKDAAGWRTAKIWTADSAARGELGFAREKQSLAFDAKALTRQLRIAQSEGVVHKLDCGCLTCGSRLSETIEDETWNWNDAEKKLERSSYERRYIVQPGENMLTVARKALGDARLIARIYKLNPEIKQDATLQAGQKILVEQTKIGTADERR
jgi:hypothetical protein